MAADLVTKAGYLMCAVIYSRPRPECLEPNRKTLNFVGWWLKTNAMHITTARYLVLCCYFD